MLKFSRYVLGAVAIALAVYGLMTKDFSVTPYMLLVMAIYMLVFGLSEFKEGRRENGLNLLFVCVFTVVVLVAIVFF